MMKTVGRVVLAIAVLSLILVPVALLTSGVLPYQAFVVQTGSMSPVAPPASLVIVEVDRFEVGQVITFRKQDELVTHRLISSDADGTLTTKGDANASADPSTTIRDRVIGGVVQIVPGLGFWVMYFHNPMTIVSMVLWALTLWFVWPRDSAPKTRSAQEPWRDPVRVGI